MNPRFKRQWNISQIDIQVRFLKLQQKWNGGNNGSSQGTSQAGIQADTGNNQGQPNGQEVYNGAGDQRPVEAAGGDGGEEV